MIKRLSALSSLKDIHWPKFIATFLAFVFSLVFFLGILFYIHDKEATNHHLELILHEQQMQISLVRSCSTRN